MTSSRPFATAGQVYSPSKKVALGALDLLDVLAGKISFLAVLAILSIVCIKFTAGIGSPTGRALVWVCAGSFITRIIFDILMLTGVSMNTILRGLLDDLLYLAMGMATVTAVGAMALVANKAGERLVARLWFIGIIVLTAYVMGRIAFSLYIDFVSWGTLSPQAIAQLRLLELSVIPASVLSLCWLTAIAWMLRGAAERVRERQFDACPACGYDMRGIESQVCPECGGAVAKRPCSGGN